MCPLQAKSVPKYGQKFTLEVESWAPGAFRGGAAAATKDETGLFGAFSLLEILRGWGLEREEWGFLDQAGVN